MNLTDISTIKTLCAAHGFSLSKEFGQNFIVNPGICPKIAEAAGIDERFGVLEVGPGVGVLTKELARRAKKVVAVEVDKRLPPLLAETLAEYENVTVVEGDVLKVDLAALIRDEFPGLRVAVCANLPYYITSPIVMKLLEERLPMTMGGGVAQSLLSMLLLRKAHVGEVQVSVWDDATLAACREAGIELL